MVLLIRKIEKKSQRIISITGRRAIWKDLRGFENLVGLTELLPWGCLKSNLMASFRT